MGYSDQKFYARPLVKVLNTLAFGTSTGAGTASNSLAAPAGQPLPTFAHRTKVGLVKVVCLTAPAANNAALALNFLNGTSTFCSVTVTTATQGQSFLGTSTESLAIFAAGTGATYNMIGTYTASGGTSGTWDVYFQDQEQYVAGTDTPA